MSPDKRACLSFICASFFHRRKKLCRLYDQDLGAYRNYIIDNQIGNNYISVYDYSRRNYIMGTLPNLFDYESSYYIDIHMDGNQFNGYDYESSSYYFGEIMDNQIRFFDYADTRNHYYLIS